jgi:adenylyltransferase/sulfurtransferase
VALSESEAARYACHLALPGFVPATQEFLRAARVQVVGAGELAGPAMLYLAAAGVGALLVDDALDLAPEDVAAWPYGAGEVGLPRVFAALPAIRAAASSCVVRPYATGTEPTAALICVSSPRTAREGAERARLSGLPHVVALGDGADGEVVSVPVGAPCYLCGTRMRTAVAARPGPTAAALGALAALELLQILAGLVEGTSGRRVDLVTGFPQSLPTTRVAGCACAQRRRPG